MWEFFNGLYRWAGENWLLGPIGVEVVRGDANMVKRTERMTVKPLVPGFSLGEYDRSRKGE